MIVSMNVRYLHATVELIDGGEREEREREREREKEREKLMRRRRRREKRRRKKNNGICTLRYSLPEELGGL